MLTSVSNPDLHLLRVFMTVAEVGGFSKAQIKLNVGQSTISTQIIDLEKRLGMVLCRRGRSGFALTEEGRKIYNYANELLSHCEIFSTKINSMHGNLKGDLRLGMADSLLGNKAFPFDIILAELTKIMPNVVLKLQSMDPLEIERLILEQKLDMGLHNFPNHTPGLKYVKMFEEEQSLYCGKEHPLFKQVYDPTDEELEEYDYASRSYYGGSLRPGNLKPRKSHLQSGNMEGITAAILSGRFIGHLPAQSAAKWVTEGLLKALAPERNSYSTTFECVFPLGPQITKPQRILEEIMIRYSKNNEIV